MSDTIFALSTPLGRAALAVIRISGAHALIVPPELFACPTPPPRQAKRVWLKADGVVLDEVILLSFAAPASATGEDCLEIHCHGSQAVIRAILARLGASPYLRSAQAGEFTRRALDHGKLDLAEIEGLADLIDAETERQRVQALAQFSGKLSRPIEAWRQDLISMQAVLESVIDFADEDIPADIIDDLHARILALRKNIAAALQTSRLGEMVRSGVSVVLIGAVNAGKSTAMNYLAGREAAIISERAGTTRDVIEVRLVWEGIPILLKDTAGWRAINKGGDEIEAIGIDKARRQAEAADFVFIVVDGSCAGWAEIADRLRGWIECPNILLVNKADLGLYVETPQKFNAENILYVSLHEAADREVIEQKLGDFIGSDYGQGDVILSQARHREALSRADFYLAHALKLSIEKDCELIAADLRQASTILARITGHIDVEDLLDNIFARFCIGK